MTSVAASTAGRMQCMEVWGGNSPVNRELTTPGLKVWIYNQPYENASNGGDVYYVSSCASGRITRLMLADVSGHGEAVSSISAELRDLMRRNINLIDQSRFVREMNQQFASRVEPDEFATALVCTFFSPTRSLQFCNAGHPLPLLYRASQGEWVLAECVAEVKSADGISDTPLGIADSADYSNYKVSLEPGDMVMCVSDAFTEGVDCHGQALGAEGLLQAVQQLEVAHPETIVGELTQLLSSDHPCNLTDDDATAILFQADGSGPSMASDLLVPIRLFRGIRDSAGPTPETNA